MLKIDKHDTPQLKKFAVTMSWAFPAVFSIALPWLFSFNFQIWPLVISLLLLSLWAIKPRWIYYPAMVWLTFAGILGWINTRIILSLAFYCLMMPIGLLLRLFNQLQYKNKLAAKATSNYVKCEAKTDKKNLEYPF